MRRNSTKPTRGADDRSEKALGMFGSTRKLSS